MRSQMPQKGSTKVQYGAVAAEGEPVVATPKVLGDGQQELQALQFHAAVHFKR